MVLMKAWYAESNSHGRGQADTGDVTDVTDIWVLPYADVVQLYTVYTHTYQNID